MTETVTDTSHQKQSLEVLVTECDRHYQMIVITRPLISYSFEDPLWRFDSKMAAPETENGKKELKITFDTIRDKNIEQLRMLNNVLFPIKYQVRRPRRISYHQFHQEKYYKECLASEDISQFASFNSVSIGAIVCRVEQQVSCKICFQVKIHWIQEWVWEEALYHDSGCVSPL